MEFKKMVTITLYAGQKKTQMYRTDFWTLWEKARVGWSERIALKHVYYQGWNRSPAQVGCMRQVLRACALGWPGGIGWRGRWEGGSGWRTHVNPWLIHVNVWQKPLQYCKVISLQLIKINEKKKDKRKRRLKLRHIILSGRSHPQRHGYRDTVESAESRPLAGRGGADDKEEATGVGRWSCSISRLWVWLHNPRHLSKTRTVCQKQWLWTCLVVQGLRICLSTQGTWVQFLVQELRSHMTWSN